MKDLEKKLLLIKDSVRKLFDLQTEKKRFDKYYEEVRKKEQLCISNFMFSNFPEGENSFEITLDEGANYYNNQTKVKVTKVRTQKIIWDCDKLKKRLGKSVFSKIAKKEYRVNNMDGLVNYLKSCGVDPKKFKKYIEVETNVSDEKIEDMFQLGEITRADVNGCYKLKLGEPYIRITEVGNRN